MRASSDTIAQLAAAMAKAQSELVNPAKSLTAVLERANGSGAQSYHYAPLSSGLDIVRKSLGKYELALIQTTHVDRERSLVLLTTTIAHGSGEWISGLWPVCSLADLGHPKLMGAALTYARRYCLFTMVGLAGEDDLDAPDLLTAKPSSRVANGADPVAAPSASPEAALHRASHTSNSDEVLDGDASSPEQELELPRRRRRSLAEDSDLLFTFYLNGGSGQRIGPHQRCRRVVSLGAGNFARSQQARRRATGCAGRGFSGES